jgi:hypothetical protein
MDVPTKDLNIIIYVKRDNKLVINKSLLNKYNQQYKIVNDYLLKFTNNNRSRSGSNENDLSRKWNYKGNRYQLIITPEKLALIDQLRSYGLNYEWTNEDFITK